MGMSEIFYLGSDMSVIRQKPLEVENAEYQR